MGKLSECIGNIPVKEVETFYIHPEIPGAMISEEDRLFMSKEKFKEELFKACEFGFSLGAENEISGEGLRDEFNAWID